MQANTREPPQLGSHTVQSHGIRLAKTHLHDWIILILLCVLVVVLGIMSPFYRFVGKDMMDDLKYPHKSSTIPIWAVSIIAALLPVVIFVAFYVWRRNVYDLHHAVLGILFSLLITGVLTNAIKLAVGRPRPDFFWRCFPDGKQQYDNVTGQVICHGEKFIMNAGHKSFPSGHTSWSFAGLSFLSLYLAGKIKAFDRKGHVAKLCIVFLPLLIASLIGISRVDDYRHHWEDVFAGGILGSVIALVCYLQFFPPPYHTNGWGPHAYFESMERNSERQQAEERNNNAASSSSIHSACNLDTANKAVSPGISNTQNSMNNDIEAGMMQRE